MFFILVLTTGSINNATFIVTILFNMFISIYQEVKAKRIIDKLTITNISKVRVIRDTEVKEILPTEIVLDDILYLKQGDSLVVDAVVIKADSCEVDESVITGESNSIIKKQGDKLMEMDLDLIKSKGYDCTVIVVYPKNSVELNEKGTVAAGQKLNIKIK